MTIPTHRDLLTEGDRATLLAEAEAAAIGSYAPYSNFHVGAAVLGSSGKVYHGANVENASYGLGICAERVAMANAKAGGEESIRAIAVACVDAEAGGPIGERMPCGACRQWMRELAPDATILISGETRVFSVEDLLPNGFVLSAHSSPGRPT